MYFLGVDAELLGEAVLEAGDVLAPLPHRQLAVGPGAAGGEQLDRIVVLGRRRVMRIGRHRGAGERSLGIADRRILIIARDVLGGHRRRTGAVEAGRGLFHGVGHVQPMGRFARRLESLGEDHSDDLAAMPDLV